MLRLLCTSSCRTHFLLPFAYKPLYVLCHCTTLLTKGDCLLVHILLVFVKSYSSLYTFVTLSSDLLKLDYRTVYILTIYKLLSTSDVCIISNNKAFVLTWRYMQLPLSIINTGHLRMLWDLPCHSAIFISFHFVEQDIGTLCFRFSMGCGCIGIHAKFLN
jgi:hypothetical protein